MAHKTDAVIAQAKRLVEEGVEELLKSETFRTNPSDAGVFAIYVAKSVIEKSQVDRSPADRTVTPHTPDQRHGLPQGNLTVSGHRGPETPALGVSSTARQLTRGGTPNTTQRWLEQRGATIGVTFTVSLGSMEPAAAPQNMTEPVADDGTHDEEPVRKKNKIIS